MKPGISLCVMVKDEEKNLPTCLEKSKGIVNEIIVCDTGSTDKTVEVAKSFGAEVIFHDWHQDMAEVRNFLMGHARYEYALVLDADECLSPKDYEAFRAEALFVMGKGGSVCFPERNYTDHLSVGFVKNVGEYPEDEFLSGWFVTPSVRLMPTSTRYEGQVHENPMVDPGGIVFSKIPLHHWAQINPGRQAKKGWYWDGALAKIKRFGDGFEIRREMGAQAMRDGNHKLALDNWTRAVAFRPDHCIARVNLAAALVACGKIKAAKHQAYQAHHLDKTCVEAAYNVAWCELLTGRAEKASRAFMSIIESAKEESAFCTSSRVLGMVCQACLSGDVSIFDELRKRVSGVDSEIEREGVVSKLKWCGQDQYATALCKAMGAS